MINCLPAVSPDNFKGGGGEGAVIASLSPSTNPKSTVNLLLEEVHSDLTLKFAHPQDRQALGVKLNDIAALGEALFYSVKDMIILAAARRKRPRIEGIE